MESMRDLLPSLNGLVAFESAGRLSSFSAAARELKMTQAAISYAVSRLERQLGTALFQREYRRVRLTESGRKFHAEIAFALGHIHRSVGRLRDASGDDNVTLSCSTAFAAYWMVPRMQAFRAALPGIDLRIQTADRDLALDAERIPLGIRGGHPQEWPEYASESLADEEIYPVCGAGYLAQHDEPATVEHLLSHRLIHLEEPFRTATTWAEWFASVDIGRQRVPRGLQINDYVLVIQSVIEGQGIALGWHHLVAPLVAKGVLRRLTGHTLATGKQFHVTWPRAVPLSRSTRDVRDWLLAQGALDATDQAADRCL